MSFFYSLQSLVNSIWRALVWVFGVAKSSTTNLSPRGYQIVHLIVVVLITLLLGYFSDRIPGGQEVNSETEFINRYLYGILFVLLYLFVRLVVFVIRLFGIEDAPEFPDLDQAWSEALQQLARHGLDLRNVPLVLVAGLPEDQECAFLMGAKVSAMSTGPSPETSAPLRLFANSNSAFLFISGASAIAKQLIGKSRAGSVAESFATILPSSGVGAAVALPALGPALPLSAESLAESRRRLLHVCRLINAARVPFCGINGLITVVPVQWAEDNSPDFSHVIAQDVQSLHEGLEMLFPVVCLFSGIESLGGLSELMTRAAAIKEVKRPFSTEVKAGSHFASGRPIDPEAASWVTRLGVGWFRDWVYAIFRNDPSSPSNLRLYRLLSEISDRRRRLAKLLTQGFGQLIGGEPVQLLGVYFSGRDSQNHNHVFVKQLLDNLLLDQDSVSWSSQRIQRDQSTQSWTYAVYGVLGLITAFDLFLIYNLL
jgi:hypothetical protein